jgi:hypothetical protein
MSRLRLFFCRARTPEGLRAAIRKIPLVARNHRNDTVAFAPHKLIVAVTMFASSLLVSGCAGYHVGPVTQHNFKTIAVPMFQNRTLQPQLEAQITNATVKRLQEDGSLRVESEPDADVVLDGAIIHYERTTLRTLQNDTRTPREFEIAITVRVEAKDRRSGEIVLKSTEVIGKSDVFIGADQQSAEFQALPLIADDIGRRVAGLLVESWGAKP